ncbi:MAG: CDGSH iron-sulfur domain-containing protein [bacterium]
MPHRSQPVVAKKGPYVVQLEAGKTYWWCSCGRSQSQPFCDGSHQGTNFSPVKLEVEKDDQYVLCGCKHTRQPPFCDRSHGSLD